MRCCAVVPPASRTLTRGRRCLVPPPFLRQAPRTRARIAWCRIDAVPGQRPRGVLRLSREAGNRCAGARYSAAGAGACSGAATGAADFFV